MDDGLLPAGRAGSRRSPQAGEERRSGAPARLADLPQGLSARPGLPIAGSLQDEAFYFALVDRLSDGREDGRSRPGCELLHRYSSQRPHCRREGGDPNNLGESDGI